LKPSPPRGSRLTRQQEISLAARIQAGDLAARDELVTRNVGLAMHLAGDYPPRYRDDLVAAGLLGLVRAADRFDPASHIARFSTYARHWIRLEMIGVMHETQIVAIPAYLRARERIAAKEAAALEAGDRKFLLVLSCSRTAKRDHRYFTLQDGIGEDDEGRENDRVSAPPDLRDRTAELEWQDTRAALFRSLAQLDPTSRHVITRHYGLGGRPPQKLTEIGADLSLTREWIRKVKNRALDLLRKTVDPNLYA